MKFVSYKCDCGCYFAVHTFNASNAMQCPACWDDTGVANTDEIEVEEKKGFNEIVKHLEDVGLRNYKSTSLLEEIVQDQRRKIKWYQDREILLQNEINEMIDKLP